MEPLFSVALSGKLVNERIMLMRGGHSVCQDTNAPAYRSRGVWYGITSSRRLLNKMLVFSTVFSIVATPYVAKKASPLDTLNPRDFYLDQLLKGVSPALKSFKEETGRFVRDGWTVDHQELIYPLAYLYSFKDPKNSFFGDKTLLNAALKGGDAICDAQYEDGTVEFLKSDGSSWGRIYPHETLLAWLETYDLLKELIEGERKTRWERGLQKMADGVYQQILGKRNQRLYSGVFRDEDVDWGWGEFEVNHFSTWDGLNVYRAGQIFNRSEWQQTGQRMIHSALETLDPLGYWPEFGSPSTSVNLEYLQAVGLYYEHSGDLAVIPYLERAVDFQIKYVYPEGSVIETLDGRCRYNSEVLSKAHFTFSQFAEGRRFARFLVNSMLKRGTTWPLSTNALVNFVYFHDGIDEPLALEKTSYLAKSENKALVRRKSPWFYCLSGFTAAPSKNRWSLDRQNFVSVWNEQVGLIISGGSSKTQPEWSNFVFYSGGRPVYIPSSGIVREKSPRDAVTLTYEGKKASIEISEKSKKELQIKSIVEAQGSPVTGQLLLYLKSGNTLRTATGKVYSLSEKPLEVPAENSGGWIEYEGWRITLPPRSQVIFPSYPFFPQDRQSRTPLSEARGLLIYPLDEAVPSATFTITVMKP
jgi:hypothetical protein